MSLYVHTYSIKFCQQWLDSKGRYKYTQKEIDVKELTQDQLDYLHRQGDEILQLIEYETFRRLNESQKTQQT